MRRAAVLAVLAALATTARAQVTYPTMTFVAVDAVELRGSALHLTGVLDGEDAPVTRVLNLETGATDAPYVAACERYALLAMERPGRYRLEVTHRTATSTSGVVNYWIRHCRLVRNVP